MSTQWKPGFTLAEVLIALALLGVVAAFTIPKVLQSSDNEQKKLLLRETIGIISAMVRDGIDTGGIILTNPPSGSCTMPAYLRQRLNSVKECPSNSELEGCWDTSKGTMPESNENAFLLPNGVLITGLNGTCFDNGFAIDWNGTNPPNTVGDDQIVLQVCAADTGCGSGRKGGRIFPNASFPASTPLYRSLYQ